MRFGKKSKLALISLLCLTISQPVYAQSSSNSYRVDETYFGSGGAVDQTSNAYQAQSGLGSLGVGSASSTNYDAEAGFYTPNEIFLEFVVTDAVVDLGVLSTTSSSSGAAQAGTCNCSFYVRSYLSSGYVVVTASDPPTSEGGAILTNKAVLGVPSVSPTVEEFGINLKDNTTPNIGAESFNDPSGSFADGTVATGYNTVDQFKYVKGDVIASTPATVGNPGTGKTNYTISYIAKRKNTTPAGNYRMDHVLVATATF